MRTYVDPRVQAVIEQQREAEFYQAAMRIRPLGAPHKRVTLLSQIPMRWEEGLRVGTLCPTQELLARRKPRRAARSEAPVRKVARALLRRFGWVTAQMLEAMTTRRGFPHAC